MKISKKITEKIKDCVIAYFAPDYDTIKAENKQLKQDIYNLIRKENQIEGLNAKIRWELEFQMNDIIWFGDVNKTDSKFEGLLYHSK
jgi:hypothetical protein